MPLFKNTSGQKLPVYAWDTANSVPKTGDAANITCTYKLDSGAVSALTDTNPTEVDAVNMPGLYLFDLAQAETNGDLLVYFPKSATSGIALEPMIAYSSLPAPNVNVLTIEGTLGLSAQMKADVATETGVAILEYDPPTKAELDSAVAPLATGAAISALNNLSQAQVQTAATAALNAYDPPTKAEFDSGLAGLNDVSQADVQSAAAAAMTAYDPPTKAELDAAQSAIQSDINGLNDINASDVRVQVDAGLAAYDGPTKAELDAAVAPLATGADLATVENQAVIIGHLTDIKGTSFVKDTDSLKNLAHAGADGDTLETLSDQLDVVQGDLNNPDQFKADVSGLATAAGLTAAVAPLATGADLTGAVASLATTAALTAHDGKLDQVKAKTDLIPSVPASQGDVTAVGSKVDTVDGVADSIKTVTDKLNSALEQDGEVFRYTENALEMAPGGAGGGDATAANQETIIGLINGVSAQIDDIGGQAGAGALRWTYTLTEEGTGIPIADADVWITTDEAGANVIASGRTNQYGVVAFDLDAGVIYVWRQKSGWNFVNPETKTVAS